MLQPVLLFNRPLTRVWKNFQFYKAPLISRSFFIIHSDQSTPEETSETMSSKNKKQKLSDSESSASASGSGSDSDSPPPTESKRKSNSENDSKRKSAGSAESPKGESKSRRVEGEKEPTWELGSRKFITVHDFKGKTYVNVREYYEKDGKVLPGKKGISLNVEQWNNLCSSIDEVNNVLKK